MSSAVAQEQQGAWTHELVYTADVTGVLDGGRSQAGRFLDNLDFIVDGDLERAFGWSGAKVHLYVLNNSGGAPNDLAQTAQGVDNIEVGRARTRLYELWLEQGFADGQASVLVGLYDLNSEFYSTDASGLLISPSFGIGSELASTGPNGPSIFPSTTLAVRLRVGGETGFYGQAAVLNADARTLGDPEGVNTTLDDGPLWIGQAGWRGAASVAAGVWAYGERQDDIRDTTPDGAPAQSRAAGAYVIAEGPLRTYGERTLSAFMRAGVADGDTTPFEGGWQAGLRLDGVLASRPDSAFSMGVQQGYFSSKARANGRDEGLDMGRAESGLEITYSDTLGRVSIQPDLQLVFDPAGDRARDMAVIGALRLTIDLS